MEGCPDFQIASKDLSMIDYIKELNEIGVTSLKIEGRMRSIYYIATVVNAYKEIVKNCENNTLTEEKLSYYKKVLNRVSNRENAPQFFDKFPTKDEQYYIGRQEASNQDFLAVVKDYNDGYAVIEQRNNFKVGDLVEVFGPSLTPKVIKVEEMLDEKGEVREVANHPQEILKIKVPFEVHKNDIIRIPIM